MPRRAPETRGTDNQRNTDEARSVAIGDRDVVIPANGKPIFAGIYYGRYWARTIDPQLVDAEQRSRQFADVSPERMVERNRSASETATYEMKIIASSAAGS